MDLVFPWRHGPSGRQVNYSEGADRSVNVVPSATIDSVSLGSNAVVIDGPSTRYMVTLQNVGPRRSGVVIQSDIIQTSGSVTRRSVVDAILVNCGSGLGVLPTGTCTVSTYLSASNGTSGVGMLVADDAIVQLNLLDGNGLLLDARLIRVTLLDKVECSAVKLGRRSDDLALGSW
jgi:hypothetical protein